MSTFTLEMNCCWSKKSGFESFVDAAATNSCDEGNESMEENDDEEDNE